MPQIEQLHYLSHRSIVHDLPIPANHSVTDTAPISSNLSQAILKSPVLVDAYRLVNSLARQYALRDYADSVFHGTNFYLPPFAGPSVCSIHDLSVYTRADCHPPERVKFMRKEIALSLKRADMLITDSEFNRQEVAAYFGWPLEKIRAVPLACTADFRPRTTEELTPLLHKHGLIPGGYSLFVGTVEPRKNLEGLLDAYSMLPLSTRQRWPLVVIGHRGWRSEQLHVRIEAAIAEGWARYLGFAEADELPLFYAGARLFVFPSLYEGFGLPVLEAMASGVPVVCSYSSSLPEVAGDAAAMCDAKDIDTLHNLIKTGLEDEVWRSTAIRNGLTQSSLFSWKRCAEETVDVYREAVL
jgi:alpha-1,3-rhamnosyl/mannosyltransferase